MTISQGNCSKTDALEMFLYICYRLTRFFGTITTGCFTKKLNYLNGSTFYQVSLFHWLWPKAANKLLPPGSALPPLSPPHGRFLQGVQELKHYQLKHFYLLYIQVNKVCTSKNWIQKLTDLCLPFISNPTTGHMKRADWISSYLSPFILSLSPLQAGLSASFNSVTFCKIKMQTLSYLLMIFELW